MFTVQGNIWIEGPNGALIGSGRMGLLERIHEHGSISKAAREMKMSYRQAWELVDSMNKEAKKVLVEATSGGVGGGGAKVTAEGLRIMKYFRDVLARFEKFKEEELKRIEI